MLSYIQDSGIRLLDRPLETLIIEMEIKVWLHISAVHASYFLFIRSTCKTYMSTCKIKIKKIKVILTVNVVPTNQFLLQHAGCLCEYARLIESTTTLYRDREIHPSVKDLQSTTRLAELWKLHIFDTRVDFPVPVQSGG